MRTFEKTSYIKTSLEKLEQFHKDPAALRKLTPPPLLVQVNRDERVSLMEGDVEFTLWFVFLPIRWIARHQKGPTNHSFADLMIAGPLKYWRHEHIFDSAPEGAILTDRVTLSHKNGLPGLLTRLLFDGVPLHLLFSYRHFRTRWELEHHK